MPGGFSNGPLESVVYANNVDFSGNAQVNGEVTSNGQLLIGNSTSPKIRVGNLVGDSTISVTYSAPNINLHVPQSVHFFDTSISSAEILNLSGTFIKLLPDLSANQAYIFQSAFIEYL